MQLACGQVKRTGLPRASTPMLIFVLRPPRERPIASSSLPLFCTGRMLMRPHDGGVDDQVFEVWIFNQRIEKTLPNALLCPSAEALEDAVPATKFLGQIAPWCSGTNQPKHSVYKQSIVLTVAPSVTFLTRNKRLNAPPLRVRKCSPNQDRPPSFDLESHSRAEGNPLYVNRT